MSKENLYLNYFVDSFHVEENDLEIRGNEVITYKGESKYKLHGICLCTCVCTCVCLCVIGPSNTQQIDVDAKNGLYASH